MKAIIPGPINCLVAVAMFALSISAPAQDDEDHDPIDPVLDLLHSQRYEEAYHALLPLHKEGNAMASMSLGFMYLNGDWVERDVSTGRKYLRAAIENGSVEAIFNLGRTYRGEDLALYARYQEKAAQRGHLIAAQQIGRAYFYGQGVPQNDVHAYRWLFSIQLRTPVAVETWTEPLAALNERMDDEDIEEAMLMAWNHVYLELKDGFFQEEFEEDNADMEGPIKKGEYIIRGGRLIMTGSRQDKERESE